MCSRETIGAEECAERARDGRVGGRVEDVTEEDGESRLSSVACARLVSGLSHRSSQPIHGLGALHLREHAGNTEGVSEKGMGRSGSGSVPHILLDKVAAAHSNVIHGVVSLKLLRKLPCITAGVGFSNSLFSHYCSLGLSLRHLSACLVNWHASILPCLQPLPLQTGPSSLYRLSSQSPITPACQHHHTWISKGSSSWE